MTHPSAQPALVLCIDDDRSMQELISATLALDGYQVLIAGSGTEGMRLALSEQPHLIMLDMMLPDMNGYEVLKMLRANPRTSAIPVVILSALTDTDHRVRGLEQGADDYIGKPFAMKELLARVATQLRHAQEHLLSELTSLPGNVLIERTLGRSLKDARRDLFVLYVDLDNFKSFNDAYGFLRGNEMIHLTASLLREATAWADEPAFLGHIGGDDFVAIARGTEATIIALCDRLIERFDLQAPSLYDASDRERGYVEAVDRQGNRHTFPLVTLSIAIVSNERRRIADVWEASAIAAELKKRAKQAGRSSYCIDHRTA